MNNHSDLTPNLPLWSFQFKPNSQLALQSRKDLEIHLITRALKDEDFKQELLANPKAVIEQELEQKLPDDLEIQVLEETEDTIYMVLPCNPYEGMSEEQLQATLGMTYEDVARWVLEQQRNTLLDEESSVKILARAWKDNIFKQKLINYPILTIQQEIDENILLSVSLTVLTETAKIISIAVPHIFDQAEFEDLKSEMMSNFLSNVNMPMIIGSSCNTRKSRG